MPGTRSSTPQVAWNSPLFHVVGLAWVLKERADGGVVSKTSNSMETQQIRSEPLITRKNHTGAQVSDFY